MALFIVLCAIVWGGTRADNPAPTMMENVETCVDGGSSRTSSAPALPARNLASSGGSREVHVDIYNRLPYDIDLMWVHGTNNEKIMSVDARSSSTLFSFPGHRFFACRKENSNERIKTFVVTEDMTALTIDANNRAAAAQSTCFLFCSCFIIHSFYLTVQRKCIPMCAS